MHRIAVDTIENVGTDKEGYQHLIVIIDTFSRHIELYKCKDMLATSAVSALVDWVCRFGAPAEIVSDNGSQYVAELIKELIKFLNIGHLPIQPYSHEENGIVERANKEVMKHIRNIYSYQG
jgi:transposase InsO family protein